MTQQASADSIAAPFDDTTVQSRGRSYRFFKKANEFYVQLVDPDWEELRQAQGLPVDGVGELPIVDRKIVMTTGSHHHQVYWINSTVRDEFRQVPFAYHIATKQWIPNEDSFLQATTHERQTQRWNDNCIICHTVGARPGVELFSSSIDNPTGERFDTSFVELGISCEACHGPGGQHAEAHRRGKTRSSLKDFDTLIVNPARLDTRRSAAVCGQCHAHYFPKSTVPWNKYGYTKSFRPGDLLEKSRVVVRYEAAVQHARETGLELDVHESAFWPDGTHRVGGREYNGLIESGCYQKGKMTCLSCHSMHSYREPSDQLSKTMEGNDTCLQCHPKYNEQISEHTHHASDSTGSQCYNCHMPHTTFALFKGIRSHRVDSPKSEVFVKSGRPNACNLCHLDQTLQWTVDSLHKWYGQPEISLNNDNQTIAASLLWLLNGDAAQRAIAVWSATWKPAKDASNDDWTVPYVAELLMDPYAAIRFMAARSLESSGVKLDPDFNFVGPSSDRELERDRVNAAWQSTLRSERPDRYQRLLFDANGLPKRNEVKRLIRSRSDKPVFIAE
jgi:hypothetical protein